MGHAERAPEGLQGAMNLWNRIIASLAATFIMAAAIVTLLVAVEAVGPDFLPGGTAGDAWFYEELRGVRDFTGGPQAITIAATIIVALAMLALVSLQFIPSERRRALGISLTEEGALTVDTDSVRFLTERTGIINRNVSAIRCRLVVKKRASGGVPASIVIMCYPRVSMGSNLAEIRDDLQTRIKQVVEQLTGLTVLKVHVVRIKYERSDDTRLIRS